MNFMRAGMSQEDTILWVEAVWERHTQIHKIESIEQCETRLALQQVCQASVQKCESFNGNTTCMEADRERLTQICGSKRTEE